MSSVAVIVAGVIMFTSFCVGLYFGCPVYALLVVSWVSGILVFVGLVFILPWWRERFVKRLLR
jgi:hypothetical protein